MRNNHPFLKAALGLFIFLVLLLSIFGFTITDDLPPGWSTDREDYLFFWDAEDNTTNVTGTGAGNGECNEDAADIWCCSSMGVYQFYQVKYNITPDQTWVIKVNYSNDNYIQGHYSRHDAFADETAPSLKVLNFPAGQVEYQINGAGGAAENWPFEVLGRFYFQNFYYNGTSTNNSFYVNDSINQSLMGFKTFSGFGSDLGLNYKTQGVINQGMCVDWILAYDGSEPPTAAAVPPPPQNTSWNVTSGNTREGDTQTWNDGGVINVTSDLLSLSVSTDLSSNGSCRLDIEGNYTEISESNESFIFPTIDTTSHAMTIPEDISQNTDHCLYCSFIDPLTGAEPSSGVSSSGCLNLSFDTPLFTVSSPSNNTRFNMVNESVLLNSTCFNTNITSLSMDFRDSDLTVLQSFISSNFSFHRANLTDSMNISALDTGFYTINTTCGDAFANTRTEILQIEIIDLSPPVVTLISPENDTTFNNLNVDFLFNVNMLSNCTLFINGTQNDTLFNVTGDLSIDNIPLLNNTNYTWNVSCFTTYGVEGKSDLFQFFLLFVSVDISDAIDPFTCPSTVAESLILLIIFGLAIVFLITGFTMRMGVLTFLGSIMLFYAGLQIFGCNRIFSFIVMFAALVTLTFSIQEGFKEGE